MADFTGNTSLDANNEWTSVKGVLAVNSPVVLHNPHPNEDAFVSFQVAAPLGGYDGVKLEANGYLYGVLLTDVWVRRANGGNFHISETEA